MTGISLSGNSSARNLPATRSYYADPAPDENNFFRVNKILAYQFAGRLHCISQ